MTVDQESLVLAAKRGNDEAFFQLIEEHKAKLYRIAYSYLNNEADALEAIQETTFRAYSQLQKLKKAEYFSTWLIRILLNYCANEYHRQKRMALFAVQHEEPSYSPEADEIKIVLDQVITDLDPKYQQVIILKYFEDLTLAEVARVMDHPEGTIKSWLHKALQIMRVKLGKEL